MANPSKNVCFCGSTDSLSDSQSVSFDRKAAGITVGQIDERQILSFSTSTHEGQHPVTFPRPKCSEKGCVFPAASIDTGKCSYHTHQQEEPVLFRSRQPTGLLLDPARMAPSEGEHARSRKRDRRKMAAIWEQFQSDGTP